MTDDEGRVVALSTLPAGRRERRFALTVVLVSAAIFLIAVPFATVPLTPVWAFIPIYESVLVVTDLITAILLFGQFGILKSRALLVLANAYLFTALMTVAHALTFPGLFAPAGLLGAGPQSTAWLYMFWHGGFPLFVVAYARLGDAGRATLRPRRRARAAVLAAAAAVLVAVGGFTRLATTGQDWLPAIMRGNHYTPAMIGVVTGAWALSLLALVVLWRRRPHTVLDVWLMVVMCAWLFDIALAAVLNAGRFDLGFYAGRVYGLLAASFVLVVLLVENGRLYARLVETNAELDAASRAKSEFLSRISHELRTPLNGIIGFAQLLEMEAQGPAQQESVAHILKGGRHLLVLINEVLDIERIEAGRLALSLEPVSLEDVVRSAVDLVRPQAAARRVSLPAATAWDGYVLADRQRLQQVLLNLLSNAIKYNREGGRVAIAAAETGAGRVRLTIADTGAGIAPELQARLFTPFERLGAEATGVEGTGLGLALSKRLVEAMNGTLAIDSRLGEGTACTVELPVAQAREMSAEAPAETPAERAAPRARGTVLYIEDNATNLRLVERVVGRRPGLTLLSAMQGRQGLDLARDHQPSLILLDLHLPDISGTEVLAQLVTGPRTRGIPVVILSADATPHQVTRLLAQGARAYLTKPLDVRAVLAVLDEIVGA